MGKSILPEIENRVSISRADLDDSNTFGFLLDTFRMSHRKSKHFARCQDDKLVIKGCEGRFRRFAKWADFYLLTHAEGEPLLGWIAVTPLQSGTVVWFVYVKHTYRGMGLARYLVECVAQDKTKRIAYPFDTRRAAGFAQKFQAAYDPFIYEEFCLEQK